MRSSRLERLSPAFLLLLAATSACSSGSQRGGPAGRPDANRGQFMSGAAPDLTRVYQSMGLIAPSGQMPFVGSVSFLPGPVVDTTLTLISVSMAARVLNFQRDGDQYAANYNVRLELHQGQTLVQEADARQTVRVATFKETSRTDESVIWQQYLHIAPGTYALLVGIKDGNAIRSTAQEVTIVVPRIGAGMLSSPVPVYEAIPRSRLDSLPRLLARPRSSVSFSTDSILPIYLESAGLNGPAKVSASMTAEGNTVVWRDTLTLDPHNSAFASGAFAIPVRQMGIGVVTLNVARTGSADTSRTQLFVTLGEDLPIASFEEMLRYLRYFATSEKLRILRDATVAGRPQAWAAFLKATDPIPATSENEALRDYFTRIRTANERFKDDAMLGWQSDRGIALVGLGEPDNVLDTQNNDPMRMSRQQVWEYNQPDVRLRLYFLDNSGVGHYRLTTQGMTELESAIRRRLSALGR